MSCYLQIDIYIGILCGESNKKTVKSLSIKINSEKSSRSFMEKQKTHLDPYQTMLCKCYYSTKRTLKFKIKK